MPMPPVGALRTRHSWIYKETKGGFKESGSERDEKGKQIAKVESFFYLVQRCGFIIDLFFSLI